MRDLLGDFFTVRGHRCPGQKNAFDFTDVGREAAGHPEDLRCRAVVAERLYITDGQEYQRSFLGVVAGNLRLAHREARRVVTDDLQGIEENVPVVAEYHDAAVAPDALDGKVVPVVLPADHIDRSSVHLALADGDLVVVEQRLDRIVHPVVGHRHDHAVLARLVTGSVEGHALEVRTGIEAGLPLELVQVVQVEVKLVAVLQEEAADGRIQQRCDIDVDDPLRVGGDPVLVQWPRRGGPGSDNDRRERCGNQAFHGCVLEKRSAIAPMPVASEPCAALLVRPQVRRYCRHRGSDSDSAGPGVTDSGWPIWARNRARRHSRRQSAT